MSSRLTLGRDGERNYKIRTECEAGGETSEMVRRHISPVTFYESMKHYSVADG